MSERKVVGKNIAIALGIICIVLVVGLGVTILNYTSIISGKDNTITLLNSEIADRDRTISSLNSEIADRDRTISSLNSEIAERNAIILNKNSQIKNLQNEVNNLSVVISNKDSQIKNLQNQIKNLQMIAEENKFMFYYRSLSEQRFGLDDLKDYLYRWDWVEGAYVEDVFDCSEMSAYLEWRLENEGYHTVIVAGKTPWGDGYHAWLLVETSPGVYTPVEATNYWVVSPYYRYYSNYFNYDYRFETIQEALDYGPEEFDWWNTNIIKECIYE